MRVGSNVRSRRKDASRRSAGVTDPPSGLARDARQAGLHHLRKDQGLDALKNRDPLEAIVKPGQRDVLVPMTNRFLHRFGYLEPHTCKDDLLCNHVSLALRRFQAFYRLEETGTLTLETLKLMSKPRCGLPDLEPDEIGGPGIEDSDPFVFEGTPWAQQQIRWFMGTGTPDLTGEVGAIQAAFNTWAGLIPRTFSQTATSSTAQLRVSFNTGDHADGFPFDGSGDVLAHAFYPQDGRIHFDDAETWGLSDGGGNTDLQTVALHEIGHALGLRHSGTEDAVMFAFYDGERRTPHEVDIKGMRSRYPVVVQSNANAVTVPLWGLESTGGSDVVTVDLGRTVSLLAWGQVTMTDSRSDFDRDNAWAVEVFMVDGDRPGPYVFGGRHWGSDGAPSNVYTGAWTGRARRVTFRLSVAHMQDFEAFGTGNIIVLS
jgi:hypothetical protein